MTAAGRDNSDTRTKRSLMRLLGEGAATETNWYDPADPRLPALVRPQPGRGLSFGDVLAITHPHPETPQQATLFQRLLE
jgi:hypothetical protein